MKKSFSTLSDIARALNISTSTVSRALRGHHDVSPETRQAVTDMAAQLDYRPNPLALSLLNHRSNTLGLIIPEISNPFFASAISGVEQVAYDSGYSVMICQSNESYQRERQITQHLVGNRVDGLIVSTSHETSDFSHFESLVRRGFPLVFFDRTGEQIMTHKVVVDDADGGRRATEHLIQRGYKRIAYLAGPPNLAISRNRQTGYAEALQAVGIPLDQNLIVRCDLTRSGAQQAVAQLLSRPNPPDAIFCVTDSAAVGAHYAIRQAGYQLGTQFGLVGFGDMPEATLLEPNITTVQQPAFEMGRFAFDLFLRQANAPEDAEPINPIVKVLQTKLLERDSTQRA